MRVGLALLLLVTVGLGWRATRPAPAHRPLLHAELVDAAARAGDGGTLELARVADFEWDRAVVFGPYTTRADFEEGLGFAWSPDSWLAQRFVDSPLPSDGLQLVVLARGADEAARWCVLNEGGEDGWLRFVLPEGEASGTWSRAEARFRVHDRAAGAWTLTPIGR